MNSNLFSKLWSSALLSLFVLLTFANTLSAEGEPGKLSGKAYFAYVHPLDPGDDDYSEFVLNRFYFAYNQKLSDKFAVRYRLDGDRGADGKKWRPYIKLAYLSWKGILPGTTTYFGFQGTPNWAISEKVWGYRGVEKTIMDKNKIGSSADVGAGVKGKVAGLSYHLLYANGSSYSKPESNKFKKTYAQVGYTIGGKIQLSAFFDHEPQNEDTAATTYGVFAGFDPGWARLGVEYFSRDQLDKGTTKTGYSVFGSMMLNVGDIHGSVFGRYDMYAPDADDSHDDTTYLIVGYDYHVYKYVHLMPNFRSKTHGDDAAENSIHINLEYKF